MCRTGPAVFFARVASVDVLPESPKGSSVAEGAEWMTKQQPSFCDGRVKFVRRGR
jgi:hypothetical protein